MSEKEFSFCVDFERNNWFACHRKAISKIIHYFDYLDSSFVFQIDFFEHDVDHWHKNLFQTFDDFVLF